MINPMTPTEHKPELPAEVREAIANCEQMLWTEYRGTEVGRRSKEMNVDRICAAIAPHWPKPAHAPSDAEAAAAVERLIELLSAASKYVPAGALYGDILNKPVSETNLLGQIRAAMQEARR